MTIQIIKIVWKNILKKSTNSYLIYYKETNKCNILLGLTVLIIQLTIYSYLLKDNFDCQTAEVPVYAPFGNCSGYEDYRGNELASIIKCGNQNGIPWEAALLSFGVLSIYFMYDIICYIKILCNRNDQRASKIAAVLLLSEVIMGIFAGVRCIMIANYTGTVTTELLNSVAVIFVHDIDDKIYEGLKGFDISNAENNCNRFLQLLNNRFCIFWIFIGVMWGIQVILSIPCLV